MIFSNGLTNWNWNAVLKRVKNGAATVVFTVVSMLVLWALLVGLMALLIDVVAPNPYYTLSTYGVLAGLITIAVSSVWVLGHWHLSTIPEERSHIRGKNDPKTSPIVADFRRRSGLYRTAAGALFGLLGVVTTVGFFFISTPARERASYHEGLPGQLPGILEPLMDDEGARTTLTDPNVVTLLHAVLDHGSYPTWSEVAGSLALLFVLVQVIAYLAGHMVRLAWFYDSRADYLQLGGKTDELTPEQLLQLVDPAPVIGDTWIGRLFRTPQNGEVAEPAMTGIGNGTGHKVRQPLW